MGKRKGGRHTWHDLHIKARQEIVQPTFTWATCRERERQGERETESRGEGWADRQEAVAKRSKVRLL